MHVFNNSADTGLFKSLVLDMQGTNSNPAVRARLIVEPLVDDVSRIAPESLSGSADALALLNSSNQDLYLVDTNRVISLDSGFAWDFQAFVSSATSGAFAFRSMSNPARPVMTVRGTSSQTGDIQQWQDNLGTVLALINANGGATFNESAADTDFLVKGDTDNELFAADASVDRVGVGTSTPQAKLDVDGGIRPAQLTADPCGSGFPEGAIFYNDTSNYMCFCDGTNDVRLHDPLLDCF